mmetsp:Transcript_23157/g.61907  ORF Transcript_23157/g.61907 Transcript_23157/m.61907 type:complete len:309 (-) Transcript_23157:284-1210(-)
MKASFQCILHLVMVALPAIAFAPRTARTARVARPTVRMGTAVPIGATVESLLSKNKARIDKMDSGASELTRLRFAMAFDSDAEATSAFNEMMKWRAGEGKALVAAAEEAVAKATAGGGWDNDVVRDAAPHGALINDYIAPKNTLTLSTDDGDLVYVIRASLISDKDMMDKVTVDQLAEFFLYVKEVHSLVANARSERTGRLCQVIFANDISGTRQAPDSRFSKALTASSAQYEKLYPSLAGPTMILNLPFILQAFVGLLKPLFPKSVQERLKFKPAPVLKGLKELTPLTNNPPTRKSFLNEIKGLLRA